MRKSFLCSCLAILMIIAPVGPSYSKTSFEEYCHFDLSSRPMHENLAVFSVLFAAGGASGFKAGYFIQNLLLPESYKWYSYIGSFVGGGLFGIYFVCMLNKSMND